MTAPATSVRSESFGSITSRGAAAARNRRSANVDLPLPVVPVRNRRSSYLIRVELGEGDGPEFEDGGAIGSQPGEGAGPLGEDGVEVVGGPGELGVDLAINQRTE